MNKPYKQLLGNRIYVEFEEFKEPTIQISQKDKEELLIKHAKKLNKLKVFDVGDSVNINLKKGDQVFVNLNNIREPLFFQTEDESVTLLLITPLDIIHIW
mgnify:CR=1 FL=1